MIRITSAITGCPGGAASENEKEEEEEEKVEADLAAVEDAMSAFFQRCALEQSGFLTEAEPVLFEKLWAPRGGAEGLLQELIDRGNVELQEEHIPACLEALDDAPCNGAQFKPCADLLVGKLGEGDECTQDSECTGALTCFVGESGSCGTCTPAAGEGDSCAAADCTAGLSCFDDVCVPEPEEPTEAFAVGDACDVDTGGCGGTSSGLACVEGTCVAISIVDEGETCDTGDEATLYCRNQATTHICFGVCTKRPGAGEECLFDVLCDTTQAVCNGEGRCVDEGGEGEACVAGECQAGLFCNEEDRCVGFTQVQVEEPPVCE